MHPDLNAGPRKQNAGSLNIEKVGCRLCSTTVYNSDDTTFRRNVSRATDFLFQNVISLSGYIYRKVLNAPKLHECNVCHLLLGDSSKPTLQHTMFLNFKEYKEYAVF